MTLSPTIIGQFLDAALEDYALADKLLRRHPELKSATMLGESLVRFLAIENYAVGVRYLAERGWPIDERDDDGTTPLIDAVRAGAGDASMALLELGADPNANSETYFSPLHCAIAAGNVPLVRSLLEYGANPAYTTGIGETAFDVIPNRADKSVAIRAALAELGHAQPGT